MFGMKESKSVSIVMGILDFDSIQFKSMQSDNYAWNKLQAGSLNKNMNRERNKLYALSEIYMVVLWIGLLACVTLLIFFASCLALMLAACLNRQDFSSHLYYFRCFVHLIRRRA